MAIMFGLAFGQSLLNNLRSIHDWLGHVASADFFIRPVWSDPTTLISPAPMPETIAGDLESLPGVEHVDKLRWTQAHAAGRPIVVLTQTFAPQRPLAIALTKGDPESVRAGLSRGEVVVGMALARDAGLDVGDEISVETRHGPQQLRIAGIATEYTVGGMTLNMEWDLAKKLFDTTGVHIFMIRARPGAAALVEPRLKAFCGEHRFLFQSLADVRAMLDRQMAGFLALLWILMALVFVIASLGIVNTLTVNVLEQTRELGVLRAIGMKRGQVRKMVLAQALAMALVSLLPGILSGLGMAYLMNLATYSIIGQRVDFHVDGSLIASCFVVAVVVAILAALLPARRAARLQVIQALQYE
jgi:putative ABC transport system permease protein